VPAGEEARVLNHIIIMGRMTRDPELRRTQSGLAGASFALACDRDYKPPDGERETDFVNCVAWRSTAEYICKYFPKGRMAIVTGRLQVRSYTDRDGNKRTAAEVVTENIYYGDYSKPASLQAGGALPGEDKPTGAAAGFAAWDEFQSGGAFAMLDDGEEDLPF